MLYQIVSLPNHILAHNNSPCNTNHKNLGFSQIFMEETAMNQRFFAPRHKKTPRQAFCRRERVLLII